MPDATETEDRPEQESPLSSKEQRLEAALKHLGQMVDRRGKELQEVKAENEEAERRAEYAEGQLSARRDHETRWELEHARAERLQAAIAEVRRLCDLTIATSIRAQAIDQAVDTLAVLDRALAAPESPGDAEERP